MAAYKYTIPRHFSRRALDDVTAWSEQTEDSLFDAMVHATVEDSSLEGDTEFQCVLSVPGTSYTEERSITYSSGEFSGQDVFIYWDGPCRHFKQVSKCWWCWQLTSACVCWKKNRDVIWRPWILVFFLWCGRGGVIQTTGHFLNLMATNDESIYPKFIFLTIELNKKIGWYKCDRWGITSRNNYVHNVSFPNLRAQGVFPQKLSSFHRIMHVMI